MSLADHVKTSEPAGDVIRSQGYAILNNPIGTRQLTMGIVAQALFMVNCYISLIMTSLPTRT